MKDSQKGNKPRVSALHVTRHCMVLGGLAAATTGTACIDWRLALIELGMLVMAGGIVGLWLGSRNTSFVENK